MLMLKKNEPAIKVDGKIEEVLINDKRLHLWAENPRRNDEASIKLAEIIKVRGQVSPIVVWRKNGVIYKGNTTWKAMKILGLKTIKVLWADFPSEASAIAYGIADNKSSEFSQWDDSVLTSFLQNTEIKETGFSSNEIRGLGMFPDLSVIDKVNAKNSGIKDKIIIMVMDAAKKDMILEMLEKWIKINKLTGIELK